MWLWDVRSARNVVPDDNNDLPQGLTKGLYIGGAGDVSVVMLDGSSVVLHNLEVGEIHVLAVARIKNTGTTATNIVAFY